MLGKEPGGHPLTQGKPSPGLGAREVGWRRREEHQDERQRDPAPQPQCPPGLPAQRYLAVCRLSGLLGAPQGRVRQALIQL